MIAPDRGNLLTSNLQYVGATVDVRESGFEDVSFSYSIQFDCGVESASIPEAKQVATPSQENLPPILSSKAVRDANLKKEEFKTVLNLKHGSLALRLGKDSALEWCLTYKDVEPGKMQEKVQAFAAELNKELSKMVAALPYKDKMPNGWRVYLADKCELPEVSERKNVMVFSTTLIKDSFNRHRSETTTFNGDDRLSMDQFLNRRGQTWVKNHHVRLAIAAFRVFAGFPKQYFVLATVKDPGDLCEGKFVRTDIQGSYSGSAASCQRGVHDYGWLDGDRADAHVGVVGGLSPELRN
jgi:hypothetical protein